MAGLTQVGFHDLRQFRQLIPRSRLLAAVGQLGERKGRSVWDAESPALIVEFVLQGFGRAELPFPVAAELFERGRLVRLHYPFQRSDILEGLDVVWTEQQALRKGGTLDPGQLAGAATARVAWRVDAVAA